MSTQRWLIAPEHDEAAFRRVGASLKQLGFEVQENWNALAGSQDISHWELSSPIGALIVERETYVGLWVEGPAEVIDRLRHQFDGEGASA
jgi:hypothetical protein